MFIVLLAIMAATGFATRRLPRRNSRVAERRRRLDG
jgi:hypothetical protein